MIHLKNVPTPVGDQIMYGLFDRDGAVVAIFPSATALSDYRRESKVMRSLAEAAVSGVTKEPERISLHVRVMRRGEPR